MKSIYIFILISFFGTTTAFSQVVRVRFYCANDAQDSILCRIVITDKSGHRFKVPDYVYSYPLNVTDCQQVDCYPDEPSIFYETRKTCAQIDNIILIDVKSVDIYNTYRKMQDKIQSKVRQEKGAHLINALGQNKATLEKGVSF